MCLPVTSPVTSHKHLSSGPEANLEVRKGERHALNRPRALLRGLGSQRPVWSIEAAAIGAFAGIGTFVAVTTSRGIADGATALAGAMAVLYARGEPHLRRILVVALIRGALTLLTFFGALTAWASLLLLVVLTAAAGVSAAITEAAQVPIPGPTIVLVAITIVITIPHDDIGVFTGMILMLVLGNLVAVATTASSLLWGRQKPERDAVITAVNSIADALSAPRATPKAGRPHGLRS